VNRRLGVLVATVVVAGGMLCGCTSEPAQPPTGAQDTTPASTSPSGTRFDPVLGFSVPDGFVFTPTDRAAKEHAGLFAAVPGAFSAQSTWTVRPGAISATISRLIMTPNYLPANPEALLEALAATPYGADSYKAWDTNGAHVVCAHMGWIDSYAWVDANQETVWVLTEGSDQHSNEWPGLIADFIAVQA
jgi:hypothetical protein